MNLASPLFTTLALSLLAPAAMSQSSGDSDRSPFHGLQKKIDAVGYCYCTAATRMTAAEATQLAGRLSQWSGIGLVHLPERDGTDRIVFQDPTDPSSILDVDLRSGSFQFNAGMKDLRQEGDTPNLPADQGTARQRAMQSLRQLNRRPDREEVELRHFGGLNMAVHREDGSTDDYRKLASLRLGRRLDELPVEGPGSRIVVHLGEGGSLHGLTFNWDPMTPEAVHSEDKLLAMEVQRVAQLRLAMFGEHAASRSIEGVRVVNFDDGFGRIDPAVLITLQMEFVGPDGETFRNPADFYVPLLRQPKAYFPFMEDLGVPRPDDD